MEYLINNQKIEADKEGYLSNKSNWSEQLALIIAEGENIEMTENHWEVVHFVRDFYLEYYFVERRLILMMLNLLDGSDAGEW